MYSRRLRNSYHFYNDNECGKSKVKYCYVLVELIFLITAIVYAAALLYHYIGVNGMSYVDIAIVTGNDGFLVRFTITTSVVIGTWLCSSIVKICTYRKTLRMTTVFYLLVVTTLGSCIYLLLESSTIPFKDQLENEMVAVLYGDEIVLKTMRRKDVSNAIDNIQQYHQCCGYLSLSTYRSQNRLFTETSTASIERRVYIPKSCCDQEDYEYCYDMIDMRSLHPLDEIYSVNTYMYYKGCHEYIVADFQRYRDMAMYSIAVLTILSIVRMIMYSVETLHDRRNIWKTGNHVTTTATTMTTTTDDVLSVKYTMDNYKRIDISITNSPEMQEVVSVPAQVETLPNPCIVTTISDDTSGYKSSSTSSASKSTMEEARYVDSSISAISHRSKDHSSDDNDDGARNDHASPSSSSTTDRISSASTTTSDIDNLTREGYYIYPDHPRSLPQPPLQASAPQLPSLVIQLQSPSPPTKPKMSHLSRQRSMLSVPVDEYMRRQPYTRIQSKKSDSIASSKLAIDTIPTICLPAIPVEEEVVYFIPVSDVNQESVEVPADSVKCDIVDHENYYEPVGLRTTHL